MGDHDSLLQRITDDYYRASRSWIFFIESNGSFTAPKKSLIAAINNEHLGHAFNALQNWTVSDCILAICRLTDPYGKDRMNLNALLKLLTDDEDKLTAEAKKHYANSGSRAYAQTENDAVAQYAKKYASLVEAIRALSENVELAALRAHRNNVLAHSLIEKVDPPKIGTVEAVLSLFRPIIVDSYFILRHSHFVLDFPEQEYQRRFDKFWRAVELGAKALAQEKEREIEEMHRHYGIGKKAEPEA